MKKDCTFKGGIIQWWRPKSRRFLKSISVPHCRGQSCSSICVWRTCPRETGCRPNPFPPSKRNHWSSHKNKLKKWKPERNPAFLPGAPNRPSRRCQFWLKNFFRCPLRKTGSKATLTESASYDVKKEMWDNFSCIKKYLSPSNFAQMYSWKDILAIYFLVKRANLSQLMSVTM